jgi:hypothetical protein
MPSAEIELELEIGLKCFCDFPPGRSGFRRAGVLDLIQVDSKSQ